jgi:hypothetical protein
LVADGFPINFFLGESVPNKSIAFILAWLYKYAKIISDRHKGREKGIITTDETEDDRWGFFKSQKEIRKIHQEFERDNTKI